MSGLKKVIGALLMGVTGFAQGADLTGGKLNDACTSNVEEGRMVCGLVFQSFMDGYIEGVGAGVTSVYAQDPNVVLAYRSVEAPKMGAIQSRMIETASCLEGKTRRDMIDAFQAFSAGNPESTDWDYRVVLATALRTELCVR